MSTILRMLQNTTLAGICLNCGNTFHSEPSRLELVCPACNRYLETPDLHENPALSGNSSASRLAFRLASLSAEEDIKNAT